MAILPGTEEVQEIVTGLGTLRMNAKLTPFSIQQKNYSGCKLSRPPYKIVEKLIKISTDKELSKVPLTL